MPCYHPLKGFVIGQTGNGKRKLKIAPYEWQSYWDGSKVVTDYVEIPCGKCIGCRLEYSRQWANRMMMHLKTVDSAYFITLTYDEEHVPYAPIADPDTGEYIADAKTLKKSDLQSFWKHLRSRFPDDKISYYACGEYSPAFRPHYHAIVYGLHINDLEFYKLTRTGDALYNSKSVEKCWSDYLGNDEKNNPIFKRKGMIVVANVTWETCAYVARYVTKKMSDNVGDYVAKTKVQPPFSAMSRRPGIGKEFYDDSLMDYDYINVSTSSKGLKFRPPRYFEKLYEKEHPAEAEERSLRKREFAEEKRKLILDQTDLDYVDWLASQEDILKHKLKALDRNDV